MGTWGFVEKFTDSGWVASRATGDFLRAAIVEEPDAAAGDEAAPETVAPSREAVEMAGGAGARTVAGETVAAEDTAAEDTAEPTGAIVARLAGPVSGASMMRSMVPVTAATTRPQCGCPSERTIACSFTVGWFPTNSTMPLKDTMCASSNVSATPSARSSSTSCMDPLARTAA